jgi:hypothetical protein
VAAAAKFCIVAAGVSDVSDRTILERQASPEQTGRCQNSGPIPVEYRTGCAAIAEILFWGMVFHARSALPLCSK